MQISSILDIVDGRLLNHPSISFIYSIKTNAKRVKEGDLFIVRDDSDITTAVKNGAFALIIDEKIDIIDNEIAWIYVDSIEATMKKLLRYLLSNIRLTAFYCNDVSFELFTILTKTIKHTNIKLVPKDISKFFKIVDDLEENDTLICSNQELLDSIYPVNFNFNTKEYEIKNLIEHSIFETTFSYKERYFSKIKLPSLYIKEFLDVYSFLGFDADLNRLKKFTPLKPIFIDKLINHTDYGKTDKFLLAQENEKLIEKEIAYLKVKYKYAKILYLTTDDIDDHKNIDYTFINSLADLKRFLKKLSFNGVYFIGVSFDELYNQVLIEQEEPSLI